MAITIEMNKVIIPSMTAEIAKEKYLSISAKLELRQKLMDKANNPATRNKLTATERKNYYQFRNEIPKLKADLFYYEAYFEYLIAKRDPLHNRPTLKPIADLAVKTGNYPSDVISEYERQEWIVDKYPYYIIALTKLIIAKYNGNADYELIYSNNKNFYVNAAIEYESKTNPNFHNDLVAYKNYMTSLKNSVKGQQDKLVEAIVYDHIGQANILQAQLLERASDNGSGGMGGLFSFVKKALSPIQKLAESVAGKTLNATLGNSVVKRIVPEKLLAPITGISQASAQVLSGKISKKNLGNLMRNSVKLAVLPTQETLRISSNVSSSAISNNIIGKKLDQYTGGVLTSATNLQKTAYEGSQGHAIDLKSTAFDAIKVGAFVAGGATGMAVMVASNAAVQDTALGNSQVGRGIVTAGSIAASGGTSGGATALLKSTATTMAQRKATEVAINQAQKMGVGKDILTVASAYGSGKSISELAQEEITKVGLSELNKLGVPIPNDVIKYGTKLATGESVQSIAEDEAKAYVDKKYLNQYGLSSDKVLSYAEKVEKISNRETISLEDEKERLKDKIELKYAKEKAKLETQFAKAQQDYTNFSTSQKMTEMSDQAIIEYQKKEAQLNAELVRAENNIINLDDKIANEINNSTATVDREFDRMKQNYLNFDASEFAQDEYARFKNDPKSRFEWLREKYGDKFLMYLMMKYGPKYSYENYITDEDRVKYLSYKPVEKKTNTGYLKLGAIALTAVVGYKTLT